MSTITSADHRITTGPVSTDGALRVGPSTVHGTGVFACRDFAPGDVVERCPVLLVDVTETHDVAGTVFGDYVYEWDDGYALALGFGSLYNHSRRPNARYEMEDETTEIVIVAWQAIAAGDEILINYNGDPEVTAPVWFEEGYQAED